jgi:hypothetical protein
VFGEILLHLKLDGAGLMPEQLRES